MLSKVYKFLYYKSVSKAEQSLIPNYYYPLSWKKSNALPYIFFFGEPAKAWSTDSSTAGRPWGVNFYAGIPKPLTTISIFLFPRNWSSLSILNTLYYCDKSTGFLIPFGSYLVYSSWLAKSYISSSL